MKTRFALLVLVSLFFSACQSQETVPETESTEGASVQLASTLDTMPLQASFMSVYQSFAYSFNYNGTLLKLVDFPLTGGTELGPNFKVEGGAEVTGTTLWLSELSWVPELAAVELHGKNEVYRYSYADGGCELIKSAILQETEGLVLQLRVCPENDRKLAEQAFESLLDGLRLRAL